MTVSATSRKDLAFNGKFLGSPNTGVQRVARELIRAVGELTDGDEAYREHHVRLIVPSNVSTLAGIHPRIRVSAQSFLSGFAKNIPWEHVTLPWTARHELLVNLCNLGPVLSTRAVIMIHDAQVHISPASYTAGFRAWYRLLQPILAWRSAIVLTVSHYSRDKLIEYGVAPVGKIEVIHNGCDHVLRVEPDHRIFERCPVRPRGYILAQSSTQPHKNIGVLLQAFAASELAGIDLFLFGSTRRANFEAAGHAVPSSVRFIGQVSDAELIALMKGAVAFACPSTTEGFGLPPLEAMALGCPVIVAPCGALPEVCGDAALVAAPDDASAWRARILDIADSAALAEDLRRHGLAQAENFTWAKAARRLLEILDRC